MAEERKEDGPARSSGESRADGDAGVLRRLAVPFTVGVVVGAVTVGLKRSSAYLKENVLPKLEETNVNGLAAKGRQLAESAKERVVDAGSTAVDAVGDVVSDVTGGEEGNGDEPERQTSAPRDADEREAARREREARRAERRQRAAA